MVIWTIATLNNIPTFAIVKVWRMTGQLMAATARTYISIMELTVRIVSVSELKESTFTTRQGERRNFSQRGYSSSTTATTR